jgi:hypothetical protein
MSTRGEVVRTEAAELLAVSDAVKHHAGAIPPCAALATPRMGATMRRRLWWGWR